MGFADRVGARSFQAMVAMRDGTRLNSFVFFAGERRPALAGHLASYAIGDHRVECPRQDRLRHSIGAQPLGALPRFAPARLVATSLLAVMPAFTKTRAAVTGRKARIMSTPMTPPTATIRSNGSPPSLGPIRGGGYVRLVRGCHHHPFRHVNKTPKPAPFFSQAGGPRRL